MSDPFVAEIRIFPFNFAPRGWAFCNGQLMPISQNTALFSLCGTTYGGDGRTTFALPDLQGRAPMHPRQGPGLSLHYLGEASGSDTVTLLQSEIPTHSHALRASVEPGDNRLPSPELAFATSTGAFAYVGGSPPLAAMALEALPLAGASAPHNNLQPYLTLNFCIALQGIFPPRG
jgi:microcystin-dependent protein